MIPLTFLTVRSLELSPARRARSPARLSRTAGRSCFLVAVGFWNFLGAGVFGFLINLPIVSYYEIGTALTANHGHTAMMGVYGMLAGLALFCLRYLIPEDRWSEKAARISFWSLNIGLAWMSFATLFPLGLVQLYKSVNAGYFEARNDRVRRTGRTRCSSGCGCPETSCSSAAALPLLYLCWPGVRHTVARVTLEEPDVLFAEISEPVAVREAGP